MQLAGPGVMGPPTDRDGAIAVLRDVVDQGITHIDTSGAYGPRVTNELIREALHPYPESVLISTKVGADRDAEGGWPTARTPADLRRQVRENLESLGVEHLDLVNLRMGDAHGPQPGPITEAMETLVELQQQGLVRRLGVSNVTAEQVAEARAVAPIVCVQNLYNLAHRGDDRLIDDLAADGVAYVPFFPWEASVPCRQAPSRLWQRDCTPPRCPSPSPGSCDARRTSSSSPGPPGWHTCARTSPERRWRSRRRTSPSSTPSVADSTTRRARAPRPPLGPAGHALGGGGGGPRPQTTTLRVERPRLGCSFPFTLPTLLILPGTTSTFGHERTL